MGDGRRRLSSEEATHSHEVVDGLAVDGEAGGPVGHHPLPLCRPDGGAEVRLGTLAEDALGLLALRRVAGDYLAKIFDIGVQHPRHFFGQRSRSELQVGKYTRREERQNRCRAPNKR